MGGSHMSFSIIIARDEIGPAARRLQIGLQPDRLFPIVGRSGVNTIREHLFGLNQTRPNAMGGARTNFYASAARGTHFDAVADGVKISINQVGMAQRYFGGVITAKKVKLLTIPACPEAYGHRASSHSSCSEESRRSSAMRRRFSDRGPSKARNASMGSGRSSSR